MPESTQLGTRDQVPWMRYESVEHLEGCVAEEQETIVCSHKGKEPKKKTTDPSQEDEL